MAHDDDLHCQQQQLVEPLDPSLSLAVIRESPIFAKDDCVVFPPINHENLQVASPICGFDRFLDSPSESSSPSSSSRRSTSSSSFSLFPSDSDGQSDRKSPSGTEAESPPSPADESPPSDSEGQSPLTACQFDRKSPRSSSEEQDGKSPPSGKSQRKSLYREFDVFQGWWELLLVRAYSKLKSLVTWFSTTLPSFYPVLAFAIWWWMRVRARRKLANGEATDRLRDAIKEKDERIVQLLHQIAQMNELLLQHHKDIVSRR